MRSFDPALAHEYTPAPVHSPREQRRLIGLGNATGPLEKVVLVVFGGVLVFAAVKVSQIGAVHRTD
jgi:hypothetical protein